MKHGAGAVGTRVSAAQICNATGYQDRRSVTTATRYRLAIVSDSCRLLRYRFLSSVSLAAVVTAMAAVDAGLSPVLAQA
jgi:hypothetical protein